MSLFRSRFVTACQQLLALGAVLAVLTPAASLISLDVVRQPPAGVTISGTGSEVGVLSAYAQVARSTATLPATAVDPVVREVLLTGTAAARAVPGGGQRLVSRPEVVTGDGMVGVTWAPGAEVAEDDLSIAVRTLTDG
ncbi:MAG: hypothetical protein ACPF9W_08615, partial [Nocardioides sp.]